MNFESRGHITWPFRSTHGTFIKMAYYDPISLANSCCTATQLYPMLHYGGQALMHGRLSTGRHFRVCFWRLSSFFCDRAETLVALLITLAIILAFDHWPGRVIGDYFTLECKASTIYRTGIKSIPQSTWLPQTHHTWYVQRAT